MKRISLFLRKVLICILTLCLTCTGYTLSTGNDVVEDISAAEMSQEEAEAEVLTSSSAGRTLGSGTYRIDGGTLRASAGNSGLKCNGNVILYIRGNVTIYGGRANGQTGAGAGIEVPANATLKIKGSGTLTVHGGDSTTSLPGSKGGNASAGSGSRTPGNGGAGGAGSGGAGAGIGGRGGDGGAGGVETIGSEAAPGSNGANGQSGATSGVIMLLGTVDINAYGGGAGTPYSTSAAGGSSATWNGTLQWRQRAGGGGGGGAGGAGYAAAGIGGGGAGGAGGGAGGRGHGDAAYDSDDADAGGGGGGGGGRGANGYGAPGLGGDGNNGAAGNPGSYATGGIGGRGYHDKGEAGLGGNGGYAGNGGGAYDLYKSTHNQYRFSFQTGSGANSVTNKTAKIAYDVRDCTYSFTTCTFDGNLQEPTVSVVYNGTSITEGFTKTYSNNIDATTKAIMTIKGAEKSSFKYFVTGEQDKEFTILRASYTPTLRVAKNSVTYWDKSTAEITNLPNNMGDGGNIQWSVAANGGSANLTNATTSTVGFTPTAAGTLVLRADVAQSTNYNAGYATISVTVPQVEASNYNIGDIVSYTYNGDPCTPKPNITYQSKNLVENTDFNYRYLNNVNAGEATIVVDGINNYKGEKSTTFIINQRNIDEATVSKIPDQVYTGTARKPKLNITFNNKTLAEGTTGDYTVTYSGNVEAGKATAVINPVLNKNYKGQKTVNFNVVPKNISDSKTVKVTAPKDVIFDGKPIESRPQITYNGMKLVEGKDYTLKFENNKFVGIAKVTITGQGNYTGETETSYNVQKRDVYVTPENNQFKFYGTKEPDSFTYGWTNDVVATNEGDPDYPATFVGRLEREKTTTDGIGDPIGTYDIIKGTLELSEESQKYYNLVYTKSLFSIREFTTDKTASLKGTMGEHNWYVSDVQLVAPEGYKISKTEDPYSDTWGEYIVYPDGDYSTEEKAVKYFLKQDTDNAITVPMKKTYKQDTKNPNGSIVIGDDAFTSFLNTITFNMFFNKTIEAKINGADSLSGFQRVEYLESMEPMTYEQLDSVSQDPNESIHWTESYKGTVTQDRGIIYAKITDNAGNYTYISTDGIVYDKVNPNLDASYEFDGVWTKDENPMITGSVSDELAGLKDRYATYQYSVDGTDTITQLLVPDDQNHFVIEHLPDGDYNLTIEAMDNATNSAKPIIFNIKKDTVKPELTLHADTVTISNQQVITFTQVTGCSGVDRIEIYEDGEWKKIEAPFQNGYTATKSGHEYRFRLVDGAGGISEEATITFDNIDTAQPVVVAKGLYSNDKEYIENDYTNDTIRVRFQNEISNKGKAIYEYKLDDGEWQTLTDVNGVCTTPALDVEGYHIFTLRITSQSGVVSEEKTFGINYDITEPVADVDIRLDVAKYLLRSISFGTFFNESKQLVIAAEDPNNKGIASGVNKIEYFVYTSQKDSYLTDIPTTPDKIEQLVDGQWIEGVSCQLDPDYTYVVYVRVTDKAGNCTYKNTEGLVVDATAPEIDIDYDYNGQWTHNASIQLTTTDNLSGIDKFLVQIDDGAFEEKILTNGHLTIDGFTDGKHKVIVKALDKAGNEKLSNTLGVKQDNVSPTISVTGEADESATSRKVDITAEHTGVSEIEKVEVKLDDNEWTDITDSYENGHVVKENGTWTYRVTTQAGLSSEATISYNNIFVDELTPVIEVYNKDKTQVENNGWAQDDVTVKLFNNPTNVQGIKYEYTLDGSEWTTISHTKGIATINVSGDGEHIIEFKESSINDIDLVSPIQTFKFKIDSTVPDLSIKVGQHSWGDQKNIRGTISFDAMFNNEQLFNIDATDVDSGIAHVYYYIDRSQTGKCLDNQYILASDIEALVGNNWTEGKSGRLTTNKSFVVYAKAIDKSGNVKYTSTSGIIIDDVSPQISTLHKEEKWIIDDNDSLTINVNESLAGIDTSNNGLSYSINEDPPKSPTGFLRGTFDVLATELSEGANIISVFATDRVGNKADEFKILANKDTVKPKLKLTQVSKPGYTVPNHLDIKCEVGKSGVSKVELLASNNDGWQDITETYTEGFDPLNDGLYKVRLTNGAGQTDEQEITFSNLDSTQPIVDALFTTEDGEAYRNGEWTKQKVTVSYSNMSQNDGDVKYQHSLDGVNFVDDTPNANGICKFEVDSQGITQGIIRIINKTGYASEDYSFVIKQDKTGPKVNISKYDGWVQVQDVMILANDEDSGLARYGAYSFDGGKSWQDDNRIEIKANTTLEIAVKDAVGNITKLNQKIEVDILEPIVEDAMTNKTGWATEKTVRAVLHDQDATAESGISGIATVFLTSKNPYRNGELTRTSPSLTDYMMTLESGNVYKTVAPVTDNIGLVFEDNFWIVVIDKAGNATTFTMTIDKIKREEDDSNGGNDNVNPNDGTNDSNNGSDSGTNDESNNEADGSQNGSDSNHSGSQNGNQSGGNNQNHQKPNDSSTSNNTINKKPDSSMSMDKIDEIGKNPDLNREEKMESIEDVLNDLLENDNLSNSDRMVILSTLEQLKKASDLELNLNEVYAIINDEMSTGNTMDDLNKVDQLLGTQTSNQNVYNQNNSLTEKTNYYWIPLICSIIIAGLIVIRARHKYLRKGGMDNEKEDEIK